MYRTASVPGKKASSHGLGTATETSGKQVALVIPWPSAATQPSPLQPPLAGAAKSLSSAAAPLSAAGSHASTAASTVTAIAQQPSPRLAAAGRSQSSAKLIKRDLKPTDTKHHSPSTSKCPDAVAPAERLATHYFSYYLSLGATPEEQRAIAKDFAEQFSQAFYDACNNLIKEGKSLSPPQPVAYMPTVPEGNERPEPS